MKKNSKKIDRGTLLKGSGAAALLTLLAGSKAEAKKPFCCQPGDLAYQEGGGSFTTPKDFSNIHGLRLIGPMAKGTKPATPLGWQPLYFIHSAVGSGHDSLGNQNTTKQADIYIFIKK